MKDIMINIEATECHAKFGKYIQEIRRSKHINQRDLAAKLGITQPYLSYIERGLRDVDFALALQICDALGVDVSDFIKNYM